MPNRSNPDRNSSVFEIALNVLTEHEKKMDQIVNSIAERKEELFANTKKLNATMEEIIRNLHSLEEEIGKLKNICTNKIFE